MIQNRPYVLLTFIYMMVQLPIAIHAQVLKQVQTAFDSHAKNVFQEKIFVHTSKESYLSGELVWFKIYCIDAETNSWADVSKVAYIDVLDQENQPILQAKVSLNNGSGNGSLIIPSVKNGHYKLRGYTNWMKNFGPNHFFEKQITVINSLATPEKEVKAKAQSNLQFFPEGGELVEGLSSVIGFKALNSENKGIAIKGVILNQKNDTVARFQSLKFGIGSFKFTPLPAQTYKIIATTPEKEILIRDLPAVRKLGYVINLVDEKDDMLSLNVSATMLQATVYLFAHHGQKASFAEQLVLKNGNGTFQIPKSKLAEGLSHLTLFNESGIAVAERLFFKRPTKKLVLSAQTDFSSYKNRQPVRLTIEAKDEKKQDAIVESSVSIRRLDALQPIDDSNIESYFWLSSEVKGNIESPNYYFTADAESDKALNNLLLTQGWRRLDWSTALTKKATLKFLPELNGHLISGYIPDSKIKNLPIYLTIPNGSRQFYHSLIDSTGNFIVNTKDFYGLNELIVQTNANTDTTSKIVIKSPFSEEYTSFNFPKLEIKNREINDIGIHSLGMQIQHIYAADQFNKFQFLTTDTGKFYGNPYKSYKLDDYTRFNLMEDVLREYVEEAFVSKSQKHFQIKVLGKTDFFDGEPLVLVDGAPYFNMDRVMEINPKRIKTLDVIRESYTYGPSQFKGVLSFSSYKPNLANLEINPSAVVLDYEGMQLQREFYSPSYETDEKKNSPLPDFRNQLFWSPFTLSDSKGKASLNFYTSDQTGVYIGVINGLSKNGIPGATTFTFEVK